MTLYGVIAAAIVRKIQALVAEYRKLVAEATAVERKLVGKAKSDAKAVIAAGVAEAKRLLAEAERVIQEAETAEDNIFAAVEAEKTKLKNELINKIAAI